MEVESEVIDEKSCSQRIGIHDVYGASRPGGGGTGSEEADQSIPERNRAHDKENDR
ncbi:hypothetical protein HTY59_10820, partial [Streptococcus agalactiae]|nr:hypothetical protein [Streptococcus agalactiae]